MKTRHIPFTILLASLILAWFDSYTYITRIEVSLIHRTLIVASGNGGMAIDIAGDSIPDPPFCLTRTKAVRTKGSMITRETEHPDVFYLPLFALVAGGWICLHLWLRRN